MIFYEDGHTYIDKEGEGAFTSVSQILHQLEKPKNWKAIAKRYANKTGQTVAEVEKQWKDKNTKAIERGKVYHAEKQASLNAIGVVQRSNTSCTVKFYTPRPAGEGVTGYILEQPDFSVENNTVYTEFMVWDVESRICGTADEVEIINGTININDHKTNEEIKKEGFYIPSQGREKLLKPVSHLDDCNWNKYCLQLSLYMYMLWKKNKSLKIGKLTLNHVEFDKDNRVTRVNKMDVPYLRDEVRAIIEWWKTKEK